jgi:hypothetical protein
MTTAGEDWSHVYRGAPSFAVNSINAADKTMASMAHALAVASQPAATTKKLAKPNRKRAPRFVWRRRDAQDSRFYNLQLDIIDTKQRIQELTLYRELLVARTLNTKQLQPGAFVDKVHEYLRVFRHGNNPPPPGVAVAPFLHSLMAEDVWINEFRGGIDLILSQWAVYATCFDVIDIECVHSVALPIQDPCGRDGFVVRAMSKYSAMITHNTIAIMFPHVLRFPHLAAQLIGRRLRGRSHYDFVFDCTSGRILRCDVNVDFFGAFAKLLPEPRDLSIVFNDAKLESDFYVGEIDDEIVSGKSLAGDEKPFSDMPSSTKRADERPQSPQEMRQAEHAATSGGSSKMALAHILS